MKLSLTVCLLLPALAAVAPPASAGEPFANDPAFIEGAKLFSDGRYQLAADRLAVLLQRYPRHPTLQMMLADALDRSGQWPAALQAYQAALANNLDPRSRAVAGEAVDRLTRLADRAAAMAASGPADPDPADLFALTADQVAAMSVIYPEQSRRRTASFDIVTHNPVLAEVLAKRVDNIFQRSSRALLGDRPFAHRIELIVYPDHDSFVKAQAVADWSGGGYAYVPQADGTARRIVSLYQIDEQNRFRTRLLSAELPHELAHVVLKEYFGYARSGEGAQPACPLWLEEGLASISESDGGLAADKRMRDLLGAQKAIPLADMIDLMNMGSFSPPVFYTQAASFTRFLRASLTNAQMAQFLAQVKAGQKPSVALGRALVLDDRSDWLGVLEERWHKAIVGK